MKIIIARHGETDWNKENIRRFQGRTDTKLNEKGKKQVEQLAEKLKDKKIELIFSSPLKRAVETAKGIKKYHPESRLIIDKDLRELDYGIFEGLTLKKVKEKYKDLWEKRVEDKYGFEIPEGENYKKAEPRVKKAVKKIINKNKNSLIVSHGGIGRLVLKAITGMDFYKANKYFKNNAEVVVLNKKGNEFIIF